MNAQMLANCGWGACRVGVPDGQRFYDALANAGMLLMRTKSSAILDQHICGLLWTFAKIEVPTETTRQFMLRVASEGRHGGRLWQMNPYHLASVVWALAKAFTPDNLALSEDIQVPEPVLLALAMAAQRVCEDARPFRAKDLSWIQWGAARVGLAEPVAQMLPAVVRRMAWPEESDATEVNAQDFFMVLWSMAALDVGRPTLPEDVAEPFLRAALSSLQLADPWDEAGFLSISAWSCATADLRAPADELIAVAIERALEVKANPRHAWDLRSKVLLAYAKVLHPASPTPSEVDFVADVYEESQSTRGQAEVDDWQSHIFHTAMIYLALRYFPQFRARRQAPPPVGLQNESGLLSSDMHKNVESVLLGFGLASRLQTEVFLEGGLSVDTVLLPPRTREVAGKKCQNRISVDGSFATAMSAGSRPLGYLGAEHTLVVSDIPPLAPDVWLREDGVSRRASIEADQ
ncbi:mdlA [Symbiodinium sp. CCMP2592]|nr:mdlA [Symbiodinium sp. CCMP2592]